MIERYDSSKFKNLQGMYDSWGQPIFEHQLPSIGFISENAACFLITTNCKICFLEFLISRKGNHASEVGAVMDACLAHAKELGFEVAYGLSSSRAAIKRAFNHGFKPTEQKVLLKRGL